jgi:predicted nucleic acid-binding protein
MSAETSREFLDTNVLVYAHDTSAGDKHVVARELLTKLWSGGHGCLSIQVLQEFYTTITRKVRQPLDRETAQQRVVNLSRWLVHSPTSTDVVAAIQLHHSLAVSFWDAMIIVSARRLGCTVLWSEDMNDGQTIEGVGVRNPFRARAGAQ